MFIWNSRETGELVGEDGDPEPDADTEVRQDDLNATTLDETIDCTDLGSHETLSSLEDEQPWDDGEPCKFLEYIWARCLSVGLGIGRFFRVLQQGTPTKSKR
jgi:hypothetical protein